MIYLTVDLTLPPRDPEVTVVLSIPIMSWRCSRKPQCNT